MKSYKLGILLGILSIISGLLISGIPVGRETILIIYFVLYLLFIFAILLLGLFAAKDKVVTIGTTIITILIFASTMFVETKMSDLKIVVLGWLVPLSLSAVGLYRTVNNKKDYKYKLALVLCIIGLVLAVASLLTGLVVNGGFVAK